MTDIHEKQAMKLALLAGEITLTNGAEVYRVEKTAVRLCKACGIEHVECFATPTEIAVSLDSGPDDSDTHTFIKRIHGTDINLKKISAVNKFTNTFLDSELSASEGFEQLEKVRDIKRYSIPIRLLAAMAVGAFFVPYYYGGAVDIGVAAAISAVAYGLYVAIGRLRFQPFISISLSCFAAAIMAFGISFFLPPGNLPALLVSGVSVFLPGVAITNAARDLLSGDYQSGLSRFAEAVIIAVAIATGIGAMMFIRNNTGSGVEADMVFSYPVWSYFFFGIGVTWGFAVVFEAPARQLPAIALIGGMGMLAYEALLAQGLNMPGACFFGTLIVAVSAEIFSRAGKDVTTVFILPGIIPFVPGALLYRTMSGIISGDFEAAGRATSETFLVTGSIAIGIIIVAALTRLGRSLFRKIRGTADI